MEDGPGSLRRRLQWWSVKRFELAQSHRASLVDWSGELGDSIMQLLRPRFISKRKHMKRFLGDADDDGRMETLTPKVSKTMFHLSSTLLSR